jgi:subtilisin family serine protease
MIVVFSAGNYGSNAGTTSSPGNAKNVITVGAAENYRPTALDGCGITTAGADSAQDIISFSSRGPTADNRVKPDIVAPGTHIMGAASQDPGFNGRGVCGGSPNPPNIHYPLGQTLYTWSSGTSRSAPGIAGAASLIYRYYQDHFCGAALASRDKSAMINSTRHLGYGRGRQLAVNQSGLW